MSKGIKQICPKCRNSINIGNKIILVGKTKTGLQGVISLSSKLGDYSVEFSDDFTIVEGNTVRFSCPICHANLNSGKHKNLAQIIQINENGEESNIIFSQIFGEKSTYRIIGNQIKESFGDNFDNYTPDWFMD